MLTSSSRSATKRRTKSSWRKARTSPTIVSNWLAVLAPAGTPRPIVERLNGEISRALQNAEMAAKLADVGALPLTGTPQSLALLMRQDQAKWGKLIQTVGIKAD